MKKFDIIFVDFDGTIHDSGGLTGFGKDIRAVFEQAGYDKEAVQSTMERALWGEDGKSYTYNFEKHLKMLEEEFGYAFDELLLAKLQSLVEQHNYLFPDALSFLQYMKSVCDTMLLLSAADPEFQHMKIQATGIEDLFDELLFVEYDKRPILNDYTGHKNGLYVNDNLRENSEIIQGCPQVSVITKFRSEKYTPEQAKALGVPFFATLTEIQKYVEQL
ncbi:HAD family hydrolase [Candidatus Nomurabacteria bacterium]|nr:HAD family hydrolase [Candidatus Nomurabacteria bacterium]